MRAIILVIILLLIIMSSCATTGYVYWDDVYFSPSDRSLYQPAPTYRYYSPYTGFYGYGYGWSAYPNYYQRPNVIIITPRSEPSTTPGKRPDRSTGTRGSAPELNRRRVN